MSEIEWVEPPPDGRNGGRRGVRKEFVAALKSQPGKWAKYPYPTTRQMTRTNKVQHPGTEWTARQRPDGKCDLYARWIGNGDHS